MSETIVIEAISDKFKNKYNSGSILAGGKWLQVSSKVDLNDFQKGSQMTVETKTNDKGYKSIIGVLKESATEAVETAISEARVEAKTKTPKKVVSEDGVRSYDDTKSRKILVQGVTQAVVQSPMLAGLPFTDATAAVQLVKEVSLALIAFVDEESK